MKKTVILLMVAIIVSTLLVSCSFTFQEALDYLHIEYIPVTQPVSPICSNGVCIE